MQTDIAFKGLQDSKEERGEPQRGPSVTTRRHRHTDARLTSSRHPPRMTQNGLLIARPTSNTFQLSYESSCRWAVSDTVLGWGSRPLVFLPGTWRAAWKGRQCSFASRRQVWCLLSAAIRLFGITRGVSYIGPSNACHRAAPETTPLWRLFLIKLSLSG